ncbi:MAG TPA: glycosyltransferase [Opitutaceae bacterium]|nr:glycosyltransferase [Opitutaceae bacterium]
MPVLLDLSHTSHTRARTGVQRVGRSLHAALGKRALAITHDPHLGAWRPLEAWEHANLATDAAHGKRGARWPLLAKIRGRLRRHFARASSAGPLAGVDSAGLLVPEIFSPGVAAALPALFAATRGPRVAVFHDALALQLPEFTPIRTVARFPAYLQELLAFDGIAAVSDDSREALLDYWRWLGLARALPPVKTIPLGVDAPPRSAAPHAPISAARPTVLSVGSIEGRKNHGALLDACEQLWARGADFELRLVGLAHATTGRAALERIRTLQRAGRPLRYDGPLPDAALHAAYADCAFTVYPSLREGFGLPVLESLAHGKPCVCSARGALGEAARDGGCVPLERVDAAALAEAIARLLATPTELVALAAAARARKFRAWSGHADDLLAFLRELPARS